MGGVIKSTVDYFHEVLLSHMLSQEGSLCAQHCLNALLQDAYFTAVDLAEIARELDEDERRTMAEGGMQSQEYQQFLQQPSSNFDDSGFFSIQVLQKALKIWNLDLINFTSQDDRAVLAKSDPNSQTAFICNYREHWLTIRRLGQQWFNLNSLLTGPELLSDTFLSMFLTQLQTEGYSIFIVFGELPSCTADQVLQNVRVTQQVKPRLISEELTLKKLAEEEAEKPGQGLDDDLQKALLESHQMMAREEDSDLQAALRLSMQGNSEAESNDTAVAGGSSTKSPPTQEELRNKRLAFFNKQSPKEGTKTSENDATNGERSITEDATEDEQLQAAINMSMESVPS